MLRRARWLVCLACLGCHVVPITPPAPPQSAPTMAPQPQLKASHLSMAAARLADGDEAQACAHLSQFVADQPNHRNARLLLAELLFQRGQHAAAREQFEQTIVRVQQEKPADVRHLLHCHNRLLALADVMDDDYESQLQRGISLVLLAQRRGQLGDPDGDLPVEALLCKAAGCLAAAHALRPDEARPCWYLHGVWRRLGQPQAAQHWLRQAQAAAPFSALTPIEQCGLVLAGQVAELGHRP